jgi:hypothetical protein
MTQATVGKRYQGVIPYHGLYLSVRGHSDYAKRCEHIIGRMSEGLFTGVVTPIS